MDTFDWQELEFLAEDEEIRIVPNFKMERLSLIRGEFGPFVPTIPTTVPLWLAVALKRSKKCQIQPPPWLDEATLGEIFRAEKESGASLDLTTYGMTFHCDAVAKLVLQYASEDVISVHACRTLLRDLQDLRHHKIRQSVQAIMDAFKSRLEEERIPPSINFKRLTAAEINRVRPTLKRAMDLLHVLSPEVPFVAQGAMAGGGGRVAAPAQRARARDVDPKAAAAAGGQRRQLRKFQ